MEQKEKPEFGYALFPDFKVLYFQRRDYSCAVSFFDHAGNPLDAVTWNGWELRFPEKNGSVAVFSKGELRLEIDLGKRDYVDGRHFFDYLWSFFERVAGCVSRQDLERLRKEEEDEQMVYRLKLEEAVRKFRRRLADEETKGKKNDRFS